MTLAVKKDPKKRRGGYALLRLSEALHQETSVSIQRDDDGQWLGPHGWQGSGHAFGPYPVETDAKGAFLRLGPEIVNRLEAYQAVTISAQDLGLSSSLAWPDDVLHSLERFEGGGVAAADTNDLSAETIGAESTKTSPPEPPVEPPAAAPIPEPKPEPPPAPPPPHPEPIEEQDREDNLEKPDPPIRPDPAKKRRSSVWLLVVLLVAAAAAGAWYVLTQEKQATGLACNQEAVSDAVGANAEANLVALTGICSTEENRDQLMAVVRKLVELDNAEGLLHLARWYDPSLDVAQRPLAADATSAAEYYQRAQRAGATTAGQGLDSLCNWLESSGDLLSRPIVKLYCE